ncbi:2-succinylbenzoate--CoA ligase [Cupriavidus numazuensis]|uniref:2-succinylbenzoate--CoA ligase n=1 Tax=Cupriavidus numazuensis TaxID=221992 RepID=A0ABM8TVD8_9BURK|nr:2-succinylbenzoate--CoA ligase [Cupriavidus numazuensis]
MNTNLAHTLVRTARAYPSQAALFLGTEQLSTFAQLADRVARCAGGLRDWLGLHAGDRVALILKNCPQYVELLYGIWHAGLCAVPINAKLHPREIDDIVRDSGATVCFVTDVEAVTNAKTIAVDSTDYHALFAGRGVQVCRCGRGRPRLAVLHQRNDRQAKGRHAIAPESDRDVRGILQRCHEHRSRRQPHSRWADVPRLRALHRPAHRRRCESGHSIFGRLQCRRASTTSRK